MALRKFDLTLDSQIGRHQNRTKTVASHADINTRVGQLGGNDSTRNNFQSDQLKHLTVKVKIKICKP